MSKSKESVAAQTILSYMVKQNRPYSVQDVFQNIGKDLGKTAVTKVLESLTTEGKLKDKVYGKQKVYVVDQNQFPDVNNSEISVMDQKISQLNNQIQKLQEETSKIDSTLHVYNGVISTENARAELGSLYPEIETLKTKLAKLKEGRVLISKEEKDKVVKSRETNVKEWRKRKRIATDILNSILEGYPKTKKQLLEEIGIETDEDYNVNIPEI